MTNNNCIITILRSSKKLISTAIVITLANSGAIAASIPVFNTGVNGGGGLLPNVTADPHYALIAAPSPYTAAYTGTGTDTLGPNPYLDDGPNSRWINPSGWMGEWLPAGNYLYRTTFSLAGLIPSSASLGLNIASDNSCKVFLNGVDTGIMTSASSFTSFTAYSINSGFLAGLNTLDFALNNAVDPSVGNFNPTGLRVELNGTAAVVPEPTSLAFIGLGGLMLLGLRRR